MNFSAIERCETFIDVINEILCQNYRISTETFNNKSCVENAQGFYLYANKEQVNSAFDNIYFCFECTFCKLMEDREENTKWDSVMLMYQVMINYVNKKYKFKYVPNTVAEFVELIKDMNKSKQICKYLNGVASRLAGNSLYCKRSENGYSDKKYYHHIQSKPKTVKQYVYINKFELDRTYDLDTDGFSSGIDVLDIENMKYNRIDTVEENVKDLQFAEESLIKHLIESKIITERALKNIQRTLEEEDYKIILSRQQVMSKIENNRDFNAVAIKNDKIYYGGDFLTHANKLMHMSSLIEKFNFLKKIINSDSSIILDLITDLDTEVYTEFFRHLKDDRFAKYYVETDNFTLILDTILNEYSAQQQRLRDIYTYNETQRKEKVKKLREIMKDMNSLKKMWEAFMQEFNLNKCKSIESKQKVEILEYYLDVEIEIRNNKYSIVC